MTQSVGPIWHQQPAGSGTNNLRSSRTPRAAVHAALVIGQESTYFAPRTMAETQAVIHRMCAILEASL